MFYKAIDTMLEACKKELMECEDKEIQLKLDRILSKAEPEGREYILDGILRDNISNMMTCGLDEEEAMDVFKSVLDDMIEATASMTQSMTILIKVRGFENEVYRKITIPYTLTLSELTYFVMSSLDTLNPFGYCVTFEGKEYFSADDPQCQDQPAESVPVPGLEIVVGSTLSISSGFYDFDIEVLSIDGHDEYFMIGDATVDDGKGFGIIEEDPKALDYYFHDKEKFNALDIDPVFIPDEDDFDVEAASETLADGFVCIMQLMTMDPEDFDHLDFDFEA